MPKSIPVEETPAWEAQTNGEGYRLSKEKKLIQQGSISSKRRNKRERKSKNRKAYYRLEIKIKDVEFTQCLRSF